MVNVSARLVAHASKLISDGCDDLVAAVESGELKVSTASALARLPQPEQALLLADGPKQAARRVRELHALPDDGHPRWCFGVVDGSDDGTTATLWVSSDGLAAAIRVLQAGGFRYAG